MGKIAASRLHMQNHIRVGTSFSESMISIIPFYAKHMIAMITFCELAM